MQLFIKISAVLMLAVVLALGVFLWTLDINQYKPELVMAVGKLTGRKLHIEGDLKIIPSFSPVITANAVSFSNAPWSSSGMNMITVGTVEAKASLLPLLSGIIHINDFILHDTRISLETNPQGLGNWVLNKALEPRVTPKSTTSPSATTLPPITIESILISNAEIMYIDGVAGTSNSIVITELSTAITDLSAPVTFNIVALHDALPIELAGTLGAIDQLLANISYPLDLTGRISGLDLQVKGKIERPLSVEGMEVNITASTEALSDLNKFTGGELPQISPVLITGTLKLTDLRNIDLEEVNLRIGQTDLSGQIRYEKTETQPYIIADLESELLDFTPFREDAETPQKAEFLFSHDPLPFAGLSKTRLDLSLESKIIKTGSADLSNLRVDLELEGGNLISMVESDIAGGTLTASIQVDTRHAPSPVVTIDVTGAEILLENLPHDNQKPWFTKGPISIASKGTGQGNSISEILGSYNGKFLVRVGSATMPNTNIDLFGADIFVSVFNKLNPLNTDENTTLLECAVVNLDVRNGVATIDKQIAMQTTKMSMVGSGEIDLKTEQLNLGIKPYARKGIGLNLGAITGIAKIGGTLSSPKAEIDSKGALKAGVSTGAAIATGGLSLLAQGLFNKTTLDSDPCKTALGEISPSKIQTPATVTNAPAEENKGVLDSVKSGFKGLFGR